MNMSRRCLAGSNACNPRNCKLWCSANEQIVSLQNPGCYRSIMEATASIRIGFLHHRTPCFPLRPVVSAPASTILRLLPHQEVAGRAWVGSSTRHCALCLCTFLQQFLPSSSLHCWPHYTPCIVNYTDVIYIMWNVQSAKIMVGRWGGAMVGTAQLRLSKADPARRGPMQCLNHVSALRLGML